MSNELKVVTPASLPAPPAAEEAGNSSAVAVVPSATSLAPGFRFHPTDEELVTYYLRRKACGKPFRFQAVSEIDVYKYEPWELADYSSLKTRDLEWYFFSPVDRKYGNGCRLNRATGRGYWKATGKDRTVRHKSQAIGMKKTLVFHSGRAPDGKRTNWVMHEYRLADQELQRAGMAQDAFVLCRIFQKSGLGPPNGDRYAPFIEEEWDDDTAIFVPGGEPDEDLANGDDPRADRNNFGQETPVSTGLLHQNEHPIDPLAIPFACKRERSARTLNREADPESVALFSNNKKPKPNNPNANGSEDFTTSAEPIRANGNVVPLEFSLLKTTETSNDSHPLTKHQSFDAATLDRLVAPEYQKLIKDLEHEAMNVSNERDFLRFEMMRAQAMMSNLHSDKEKLRKENEQLRKENEQLRKENELLRRIV